MAERVSQAGGPKEAAVEVAAARGRRVGPGCRWVGGLCYGEEQRPSLRQSRRSRPEGLPGPPLTQRSPRVPLGCSQSTFCLPAWKDGQTDGSLKWGFVPNELRKSFDVKTGCL